MINTPQKGHQFHSLCLPSTAQHRGRRCGVLGSSRISSPPAQLKCHQEQSRAPFKELSSLLSSSRHHFGSSGVVSASGRFSMHPSHTDLVQGHPKQPGRGGVEPVLGLRHLFHPQSEKGNSWCLIHAPNTTHTIFPHSFPLQSNAQHWGN